MPDMARYWLGDINRHAHVTLRFLPQAEYSQAAPLETFPAAQAMTRVSFLFRGIKDDELSA